MAGGLLVLTTAGYLISADTVRQQVLGRGTGRDRTRALSCAGKASVSLFPTGSVSFDDVILGDAKQPALVAERLTAALRFFPLLIGRVEIADVTLDRPNISIELLPNGQSNWSGLIEALTRSQSAAERLAAFSEMRIEGGTIAIRDEARKISRNPVGRRILACMAFDLQELWRHRAIHLARRADGRQPDARRFSFRAGGQPQRRETASLRHADEGRI
jgi:uncharacterized protein involved in outer membrane biogenesis